VKEGQKLKGFWVHDRRFAVLLQALREGNSVTVSALEYPLNALCTLASEAAESGAKLIVTDSGKLKGDRIFHNPVNAIIDAGKGHVVLL
jgi:hypothetical protein